jgi:hypothetical protein
MFRARHRGWRRCFSLASGQYCSLSLGAPCHPGAAPGKFGNGFPIRDTRIAKDMDTPPAAPVPETPEDPEVIAARFKRRLLMGAALFLALLSIYGGLLGIPWGIQLGLAGAAVFCVIKALRVPAGTS